MDKPKSIFVVVETCGYTEDGYMITSDPNIIASFEYLQDAQLSLWYWGLNQIDEGLSTEIASDVLAVYSEGHDLMEDYLYRWIVEVNLF